MSKREHEGANGSANLRNKSQKRHYYPSGGSKRGSPEHLTSQISGIFASFIRGKSGASLREMYTIIERSLPGDEDPNAEEASSETIEGDSSIEGAIGKELQEMRDEKSDRVQKFVQRNTSTDSILFLETKAPIDPVDVVYRICTKAMQKNHDIHTRWLLKLTPISLTAPANMTGIETLVSKIIKPQMEVQMKPEGSTFAISVTISNHHELKKINVIEYIAKLVGPSYKVDLSNYTVLVIVYIFKNICGVSVVQNYRNLKGFNLEQINKARIEDGSRVDQRSTSATAVEGQKYSKEAKTTPTPAINDTEAEANIQT